MKFFNGADPNGAPSLLTATNAAASVITIPASGDDFHVIDWIAGSYAGGPTNGLLTVTIGGTLVFQVAITAGGPFYFDFKHPLYTQVKNQAVVITLADGGVASRLNVRYR